jgi:hypothetical protein
MTELVIVLQLTIRSQMTAALPCSGSIVTVCWASIRLMGPNLPCILL